MKPNQTVQYSVDPLFAKPLPMLTQHIIKATVGPGTEMDLQVYTDPTIHGKVMLAQHFQGMWPLPTWGAVLDLPESGVLDLSGFTIPSLENDHIVLNIHPIGFAGMKEEGTITEIKPDVWVSTELEFLKALQLFEYVHPDDEKPTIWIAAESQVLADTLVEKEEYTGYEFHIIVPEPVGPNIGECVHVQTTFDRVLTAGLEPQDAE